MNEKMQNADRVNGQEKRDFLSILNHIYYKILKINLTTDEHVEICLPEDEKSPLTGYQKKLSDWMQDFAKNAGIYEEDKQRYLDFCGIENLREQFREGKTYMDCRYRRRIGNEFRWVSMELVRSSEYTKDAQIVYLLVREIDDDYMRKINAAMKPESTSLAHVLINVSTNQFVFGTSDLERLQFSKEEGSADDYMDQLALYFPVEQEKETFQNRCYTKDLFAAFQKGQQSICVECAFALKEDDIRFVRMNIEMAKNTYSDEIEAVISILDMTDYYIEYNLPRLLYNQKYEMIGIMDPGKNVVAWYKNEMDPESLEQKIQPDYKKCMRRCARYLASDEHEEDFMRACDPDEIEAQLAKTEKYFVYFYFRAEDGKRRLKRISFAKCNKEIGTILIMMEDVTPLAEKDLIIGKDNLQGFVRHTRDILDNSTDEDQYAVLFYNVKGFKAINELFGREEADNILRKIYSKLLNSFLHPLAIGRVEADHFVCLVRQENVDYSKFEEFCNNSLDRKGKLIQIMGRFGIYLIKDKTISVNTMYEYARLAKDYIKEETAIPYAVFDETMQQDYIDKNEVVAVFRQALKDGELEVYYQPVFQPDTHEVTSAEALIRWKRPGKGFVSPGLFVPSLEKNGLISILDLFVLQEVHKFIEQRMANHQKIVPVSVNLSWMDFFDKKLLKWIVDDLTNMDNREMIRFEITETSYAALEKTKDGFLVLMRELGSKILLDDFGSGYSSFSMLQNYEFDILKLDIGFVRQITTSEKTCNIIRSIIDMAHHMNIKVIAEGAETEEQVEFLSKCGCDFVQGFFFSKPLERTQFETFLDTLEK